MKTLFKNLGLTDKEIKTFLTLLELGAQPVSVIAKHVNVPRSTMYLILDSLQRNQLVEFFERLGIKYVKSIPAKNISLILKAKIRDTEQTIQLLQEKLPSLEALENKLSIIPKVKFFEGKESVMKMYETAFVETELRTLFNPQLVKNIMPAYFDTLSDKIKENGSSAKELIVDCKEAKEYKRRFHSPQHLIKILPKKMSFASDTIICPNNVYMISYGEKDISAIEIQNTSLAQTQKAMFEQVWNSFKA